MHPFKLHNLVVFSYLFTRYCDYHHQFQNISSPQKETPYTSTVTPHASALATTDQWTLVSVDVPILDVLYKWNICDLLCLTSFT